MTVQIIVTVSPEEGDLIRAAAEAESLSPNKWVKEIALAAAEKAARKK